MIKIEGVDTASDAAYMLMKVAGSRTAKYVTGNKDQEQIHFCERVCDLDSTLKKFMMSENLLVLINGSVYDIAEVEVPSGYAAMLRILRVYVNAGSKIKCKTAWWTHEWKDDIYKINGKIYEPKFMIPEEIKSFINDYNNNQPGTNKIGVQKVASREDKVLSDFGSLLSVNNEFMVSNGSSIGTDVELAYYLGIKSPFENNYVPVFDVPSKEERARWLLLTNQESSATEK